MAGDPGSCRDFEGQSFVFTSTTHIPPSWTTSRRETLRQFGRIVDFPEQRSLNSLAE
jgi:hypothetical protein